MQVFKTFRQSAALSAGLLVTAGLGAAGSINAAEAPMAKIPSCSALQSAADSVDLIVYGDTRSGFLQDILAKDHKIRSAAIHGAIASTIGRLSDLSEQRAVVFLGDTVSMGGCKRLWNEHFYPRLEGLKPAMFRNDSYLFFPVIGDHETYLLPATDEAARALAEDVNCGGFESEIATQLESAPKLAGLALLKRDCSTPPSAKGDPGRIFKTPYETCAERAQNPSRCTLYRHLYGTDPYLDAVAFCKEKCDRCEYQEITCHGNPDVFAFDQMFTTDKHFGALQSLRRVPGATWYSLDFTVRGPNEEPKALRVLMLDTQAELSIRASGFTQLEWIELTLDELEPGSLLVIAGHQTPGTFETLTPSTLFQHAIDKAFERRLRIVALLGAHYHNYGRGMYALTMPHCKTPQKTFGLVSGDGGARDLNKREPMTSEDLIACNKIGNVTANLQQGSWRQGSRADLSLVRFARLRIGATSASLCSYELNLVGDKASRAEPSATEKKTLMRADMPIARRGASPAPKSSDLSRYVYDKAIVTSVTEWEPLVLNDLELFAPCDVPSGTVRLWKK